MAEYVDHDLVLTRIREFRNPDGTKKNYRAAKYFTKYSEAIAFADSIRDTDRYLDVKHPINAGQPGIWAVYVLDEWPPPLDVVSRWEIHRVQLRRNRQISYLCSRRSGR